MRCCAPGWVRLVRVYVRQYIELNEEAPITIPPIESQSGKDAQRLDRVINDFRAAVDTRTRSLTLASAVIEASRQPFVPTMKVSVAATQPGEGEGGVTVAGEDQVIPTYVREKIPPIRFVRAIMVGHHPWPHGHRGGAGTLFEAGIRHNAKESSGSPGQGRSTVRKHWTRSGLRGAFIYRTLSKYSSFGVRSGRFGLGG